MSWWVRLQAFFRRPPPRLDAARKIRKASMTTTKLRYRRLHLGIDFGTCWSKVVLRDYEANTPRAFVVRVRTATGESEHRVPSAVTRLGTTLHFGWNGVSKAHRAGALAFRSIKMRAAFPDAAEHRILPALPDGLTATDLSALVVAYLVQVGVQAATQYVGSLGDDRLTPRVGMTIGVPMGLGQDEHLRDKFVEIARTGLDLYHNAAPSFEDGLDSSKARSLLEASRQRLSAKGAVQDPREWVRSEAEAGLLWIFESPRVQPGLYICTDVGAGTTDVSVFAITREFREDVWIKGGLAFLSASSSRPGVDAIDEVLTGALGAAAGDPQAKEDELIRTYKLAEHPGVIEVLKQVHEVYRECWAAGYRKYQEQQFWHNFGLFTLGGGSKISAVVSALKKTPWKEALADREPKPNEYPEDLFELPSRGVGNLTAFRGDSAFLLVAYGLSFMGADVPPAETPEQVPDYQPPRSRRSIDQDEYYPK